MNVDYQTTDWGTVVQRRASKKPPNQGGWNMFCTSFSGLDIFSPAGYGALRGNGAAAWFGWPTDPDAERLREDGLQRPISRLRRSSPRPSKCRRSMTYLIIRSAFVIGCRRIALSCPASCTAFRSSGTCDVADRHRAPHQSA